MNNKLIKKNKIFISYSREDALEAKALTNALIQARFDVWSDQIISPGENSKYLIEENLRKSNIVILFLSQRALTSEWVMMEYGAAVALKKIIIPVFLEDTQIPPFLSKYLYIKANSLNEAIERIKKILLEDLPEQNTLAEESGIKVFISYAKEDYRFAERLYKELKRAGVKPWMDREDLLPGQNWKTIIPKIIRKSSYVLALLSSNSISKRGFVQKELKIALDELDQIPLSKIFIIPIRLDDCEPIDERLQNLHYVDLFPSFEEGLNQIFRVLPLKTSEKIEQYKANLINCKDVDYSAKKLGNIAIVHHEKSAIYALWEAICNTKNLSQIIDPCAFTIGRIIWEPLEMPIEIENICFDIFEKSTYSKSELIIDKFAYTLGKIALEARDNRIRQRAVDFINKYALISDTLVGRKYTYTKDRIGLKNN